MIYLLDLVEGDKITLDSPIGYVRHADLTNYNAKVASEFEKHKTATLVSFPVNKASGATFSINGLRFYIPHWECKYFSKINS